MQRAGITLLLLVLAVVAAGCGNSDGNAGAGTSGNAAQATGPGPDVTVRDFLEAVRTGDDVKAGQLLTPTARQKTSERDMVVAPPGSPTATFKVVEVEFVEGGAHVRSDWTDVDGEGNRHTDTILWVLRKEAEGWRIAGMITKVFEDLEPIVLNFEDPDDMVYKQKKAEELMAERAGQATLQAADGKKPEAAEVPR